MTDQPAQSVRESYRYCSRVAYRASSSFYASFWLLPPRQRQAMCALYAFSRHCDDLVDSTAAVEIRRQRLTSWRRDFDAALAGEFRHAMLPAVASTVESFSIKPQYLHELMDGMEMDLHKTRYATFEELHTYCYRVASAVGLACIPVWGLREGVSEDDIYEASVDCGLAFQLTNILRDVRQDAETGRIYLPQEDLEAAGYKEEELLQYDATDGFLQLMSMQIERAKHYFEKARPLLPALTPGGRRVLATMMRTYQRLLALIERNPASVLQRRLRLSYTAKAGILVRGLIS